MAKLLLFAVTVAGFGRYSKVDGKKRSQLDPSTNYFWFAANGILPEIDSGETGSLSLR